MRILLVEDEKELSRALERMLTKDGYEVDAVYDGADGSDYALTGLYDLIILDVIMPKKNGFEVLSDIRQEGIEVPVLILTALGDEKDKIAGLDRGADDYVSKPFSFDELSARIRALLRRRGKLVADNKLTYGNAALDLGAFSLSTPSGKISLTSKEFEILRFLFEYPNFVASKDDLILKAWGLDGEFESNNLEVYISFVRKKLVHLNANFGIEAVRGVGYRLAMTDAK
ncbi:MAG: response regulator transcription factor [Clostridia bacterium]|nr:response regulator transcription factor [Clostridia bacterium]